MKIRILFLFLIIVPAVFAQSPAADAPDSWQTYKFDGGRYSIKMPAPPKEEVEQVGEDAFKFDLYSQSAESETSVYNLSYVNLGIDNDDADYVRGVFDAWEKGVLESMPDSRIKTENVEFQGTIARRVVAEGKFVRLDGIAIYREGRLIHMALGVVGDPSDEKAAVENLQRAEEFFKSFQYEKGLETTVSGPFAEVARVEPGAVFQSEEYGISLTLPEGWIIAGDEMVRKGFEENMSDERILSNTKKDLQSAFGKTEMLFSLSKNWEGNANFTAGVEPLIGNTAGNAKAIADETYQHFQRNLAYLPVEGPKPVTINGVSFYRFKVKKAFKGIQFNQIFFFKKYGPKMLQFVMTYGDEAFLGEMQESIDSLKPLKNTQ